MFNTRRKTYESAVAPAGPSASTLLEEVEAVGDSLGPAEGENMYIGEGQLVFGSISPVDQDAMASYSPHRLTRVELDWALGLDRDDKRSVDEQDGVNRGPSLMELAGLSSGSPGTRSDSSSQEGDSDSKEGVFILPRVTARLVVQPQFPFNIDTCFFPSWFDLSEDEDQLGNIPEEWGMKIKQEEVDEPLHWNDDLQVVPWKAVQRSNEAVSSMAVIVEVKTNESKTATDDKPKNKGKGLAAGERSAGFAEYLRKMTEPTEKSDPSGLGKPSKEMGQSSKNQGPGSGPATQSAGWLGKKTAKSGQDRFTRDGSQIPDGGWFKATTGSSKEPPDDSSSSSSSSTDSESSTSSSDSSSSSESGSELDSSSSTSSNEARRRAKKNKMKYERKKAERAKVKSALAGIKIKAPFVWDAKPDLDIFYQWTYEVDTWVELYGLTY
ncbi:hypothetical protein B0H13DRAFT_2308099 [Mycena leptocephala]|nr:hypothetical protein B0H13DRAFT_2308099 [Mycena leptocephala]